MKLPRRRYRLEFINENSLERIWTLKFTRLRVILATLLSVSALGALLFVVLRYTSVGKFIPGWLEPDSKSRLVEMALKLDSMERVMNSERLYTANLMAILEGKATSIDSLNPEALPAPAIFSSQQTDSMLAPSEKEKAFVKDIKSKKNSSASAAK